MKIKRDNNAIRIGTHIFRAADINEAQISHDGSLLWVYRDYEAPVSIPVEAKSDGEKEEIMNALMEALA